MTYVVVELCVDCKYTDCAAVCPVEAFHELPDRLYINADTCIDCDACVPECPVEAIFADTNVPENYAHWTQINIDEAPNYPVISAKIPGLCWPGTAGSVMSWTYECVTVSSGKSSASLVKSAALMRRLLR